MANRVPISDAEAECQRKLEIEAARQHAAMLEQRKHDRRVAAAEKAAAAAKRTRADPRAAAEFDAARQALRDAYHRWAESMHHRFLQITLSCHRKLSGKEWAAAWWEAIVAFKLEERQVKRRRLHEEAMCRLRSRLQGTFYSAPARASEPIAAATAHASPVASSSGEPALVSQVADMLRRLDRSNTNPNVVAWTEAEDMRLIASVWDSWTDVGLYRQAAISVPSRTVGAAESRLSVLRQSFPNRLHEDALPTHAQQSMLPDKAITELMAFAYGYVEGSARYGLFPLHAGESGKGDQVLADACRVQQECLRIRHCSLPEGLQLVLQTVDERCEADPQMRPSVIEALRNCRRMTDMREAELRAEHTRLIGEEHALLAACKAADAPPAARFRTFDAPSHSEPPPLCIIEAYGMVALAFAMDASSLGEALIAALNENGYEYVSELQWTDDICAFCGCEGRLSTAEHVAEYSKHHCAGVVGGKAWRDDREEEDYNVNGIFGQELEQDENDLMEVCKSWGLHEAVVQYIPTRKSKRSEVE